VKIFGREPTAGGSAAGPNLATGTELLEIGRLTPEAVLARLDTSADGLLDRDA